MCWLCDHPASTRQNYLDVLGAEVRRNGWAVQYVQDSRTPFAYTVGLHDWDRPELMVTGVSAARAARLLNAMAAESLRTAAPPPGSRLRVPGGPLAEFVEVDHPDAHLCWAVKFARSDIRALQMVWADGHGRWPWSASFCDGRRRQPVLGLRAPAA
ncbi:DUF4262 domain-containing protein [Mycobacterium sp. Y57]|uniref:DUF4262 domain-containing protein n=1 Tax=Mycolicibacterium xanthum TaxID=2796469 RepID=UPI001C841A13|nr:DUF4262 domain-containing protein [Mycolicibacterium xanthum]MBX7430969.1 DUF4262 domain-containing protein [Mycolicibacterium xanthum]